MTIERGIPHVLFWKLHTAYLKNNRHDAEKFLGMISDYSDNKIHQEITTVHFNRFLKIKSNIQNGIFTRIYGEGTTTPILESSKKQPTCQEIEFVNKVCTPEGKVILCKLCGLSPRASLQREYDLGEYGRLDLYIKDARRAVAIEFKVGCSDSSLISQIDRYRLALELNLCLGLYDVVDVFVAVESFTSYTAIELSRMSVKMIEHKSTISSMRLL